MTPSEEIKQLARDNHVDLMHDLRTCDPALLPAVLRWLDRELVRLRRLQVVACVVLASEAGAAALLIWKALH